MNDLKIGDIVRVKYDSYVDQSSYGSSGSLARIVKFDDPDAIMIKLLVPKGDNIKDTFECANHFLTKV